jgi:hypothetical protein
LTPASSVPDVSAKANNLNPNHNNSPSVPASNSAPSEKQPEKQPPSAPSPSNNQPPAPTPTGTPSTSDQKPPPTQAPTQVVVVQPTKVIEVVVTGTATQPDGNVIVVTSTSTDKQLPTAVPAPESTATTTLPSNVSAVPSSYPSSSDASAPEPSNGLGGSGKVVVAVVIPIIGIALIAIFVLGFWKKKQRTRESEEKRRKEVEEYRFNPNSPTAGGLVPGGPHGVDGEAAAFDGAEDSDGYRGWGSTNGGRKITTLTSGSQGLSPVGVTFPVDVYAENNGYNGMAYPVDSTLSGTNTDGTASNAPLIHPSGIHPDSLDPAARALMPATAPKHNESIQRGISNASSNYSAVTRSDHSDNVPPQYDTQYYGSDGIAYEDPLNYSGHSYQHYAEEGAGGYRTTAPVIRDVQARRNTRIETPTSAHMPQQVNSGIAQNF